MNNFYGTNEKKSISYLEFGSIDLEQGKKNVWDFRLHQKAYDWFMLARYANDMVTYIEMKDKIGKWSVEEILNVYNDEIHHQNDASVNLTKLCALATMEEQTSEKLSFFELGQTIFGCIEGMEFYQMLLQHVPVEFPPLDLKKIEWFGVDISDFFNTLAVLLHSQYNIRTYNNLASFSEHADVFFAKGVTLLYAVDNQERLFEILQKGTLCTFDYSFAIGEEQEKILGTGKIIKYLNLRDFYERYKKQERTLLVRKNKSYFDRSTSRVFTDCVYGNEELCRQFIAKDLQVREVFKSTLKSERERLSLLDLRADEKVEWITIEEFMNLNVPNFL